MTGGRQDAVARAHRRWQKMVEAHEDPPLDGTVAQQLKSYVEEHTK
jgi:trimethylamine:corrinoid methyltransferase-like protein